ncbi:hypothetical protein [Streptomyces cavernicola]|uniref:Energy transducer TonB n=1 Tax=Streptomyces cavernicola TaxID=3043613 RepID=A0ABT6SIU4_9ACTN|nr:hypothetical protein [Streptomyces sp. B-S-A6]MDI3407814.1 hypothetical protein [Streptomyces sp. B-S-A6]
MTQGDDDHEPVFKKSRWGTSRYVYNLNNPVGLALAIGSVLFAVVMMVMAENHAGPFAPPEPTQSPWHLPEDDPTYDFGPLPNDTGSATPTPTPTPSGSPSGSASVSP